MSNQNSEFDRFISKDNFELAWRRVRNSQRVEVKDRLSLKVFSSNIDAHLDFLRKDIEANAYSPSNVRLIYVPKKSKTLRPLTFLDMRDRLLYQAIGNIIIENSYQDLSQFADSHVFSPVISDISSDFPFRQALSRNHQLGQFEKFSQAVEIAQTQSSDYKFYVKADIAAFYPSIDHNLLVNCLERHNWLTDKRLLSLMSNCLAKWASHDANYQLRRGLPIGYEISDLLAGLFLFEVDLFTAEYCYMVRYVDDMYLFAPSKEDAIFALSQVDLSLQKRGLTLQTAKLDIKGITGIDHSEKQNGAERTWAIDFIDYGLSQGTPSLILKAEETMLELMSSLVKNQFLGELDKIFNVAEFVENDSLVAYLFYRLHTKEYRLKKVAMQLLKELPSRAFHLTQYLSLFHGDEEVIEELVSIVRDERNFAQLRAYCLLALVQIADDIDKYIYWAQRWALSASDWVLRITAIDILQSYPDQFEFIWSLINNELDDHIRASEIAACFQLSDKAVDRYRIFELAFSDNSYLVQSLGAYLFVLETSALQQELKWLLQQASIAYQLVDLMSLPQGNPAEEFRENLYRLFNIEVNNMLPLSTIFNDLPEINKTLVEAHYMKNIDAIRFVDSMSRFTDIIAVKTGIFIAQNLLEILPRASIRLLERFAHGVSKTPDTLTGASVLSSLKLPKDRINIKQLVELNEDLATIYSFIFVQLHLRFNLEPPSSLAAKIAKYTKNDETGPSQSELKTDEQSQPYRVEIFFSYSHNDKTQLNRLEKHLAFLKLTGTAVLWSDRQIPPGADWETHIDDHLRSANIILCLISPDFMDSEYIQKREVPFAMERKSRNECDVVPIIVKPIFWEIEPYKGLQALPTPPTPIITFPYEDEGYLQVAKGIKTLVEKILGTSI